MIARIRVWLQNASIFHHQLMRRYLEKRGWVVFYLDDEHRECHGTGFCWLQLYNEEQERKVT